MARRSSVTMSREAAAYSGIRRRFLIFYFLKKYAKARFATPRALLRFRRKGVVGPGVTGRWDPIPVKPSPLLRRRNTVCCNP